MSTFWPKTIVLIAKKEKVKRLRMLFNACKDLIIGLFLLNPDEARRTNLLDQILI